MTTQEETTNMTRITKTDSNVINLLRDKTLAERMIERRVERARLVEDLRVVVRGGRLVKGRWDATTPLLVLRETWAATMETEWVLFERQDTGAQA